MRNFKKFLALVLAMLMVSACAVSVSAAYTDQAAVNATGYAEAVAILGDLGVMQGSGDGSFNPNGTLTRAEAAVIAAKLNAGSDGQSYEWTAATTSFVDVDAAWSFAFINYVSQRGIMDGVGSGKFNPNGTLTIAEALTIAVKLGGWQQEVADLNEISTPAYWATHWIAVAANHYLDTNLNVWNYDAVCTRAMMAQIAYNVFNNVAKIATGFDMVKVSAAVVAVGSDTVTLETGAVISRSVFENALTASGHDGDAVSVLGSVITITYSADKGTVYGVTLDSSALSATHKDGLLANIYDDDDALTDYIKLDGTKYVVAANDEVNNDTIGATSTVKNIEVTLISALGKESVYDASAAALPAYYTAVAYDDDGDGYYDRMTVREFAIGIIDFIETNDNSDDIYEIENVARSVVWTNNETDDDDEIEIVWMGETAPTDEETPVLYHADWNVGTSVWNVTVLEVAEVVSGKLTAISAANSYITVDGTKYTYANSYVAPASWTLNQSISIFTIGGKYVNVTAASNSTLYVLVDSVSVNSDGKAVISGYNFSSSYASVELTLEGCYSTRMYSLDALLADEDDTGFVEGYVYLDIDGDDAVDSGDFVFEEGHIYKIYKTTDGYYVDRTYAGKEIPEYYTWANTVSNSYVTVTSSYIYVNDVAKYRAESPVVLELVVDSDGEAYAAASYNRYTAFAKKFVDKAYLYDSDSDKYMNFVYVVGATGIDTYAYDLEDGQTIVQILSATAVEDSYTYSVYEALDLLTGLVVEVNADSTVYAGHYYVVADGEIVEDTTNIWVRQNEITVTYDAGSIIPEITAYTTKLIYDADGDLTGSADYSNEEFGVDEIVVFEASSGIIVTDNDTSGAADYLDVEAVLDIERTTASAGEIIVESFTSFIVDGRMILIVG